MSAIKDNIEKFTASINDQSCMLVAVSKTKPIEAIEEAYDAGHRDFGENKVQELVEKHEELPKDIRWHMIGHLQRNKVKYIIPFIALIHGVDSLRLLETIEKEAAKNNRIVSCLLQVHIANEDTKFGFSSEEVVDLIESQALAKMKNIAIKGLMGMASNTSDHRVIREEFSNLKHLYDLIKDQYKHERLDMQALSMGMSGDYQIAIEEGSTIVRLGSAIFGTRTYST